MRAVTIVARNYLPFARVLARSFAAHNPEGDFTALVVDAQPGEVPDGPHMRVVTPADLNLAPDEFGRMAMLYNVTELCTALKPWALHLLLDEGADVAVYLDPDIFVYSSLGEVAQLALESGIVLTPHTTSPIPRDGCLPTEADIMGAGVYNLGFIALDQRSRALLPWWQQRLLRDCLSDPPNMLFTDQRWIDLVPGYFRHVILSDPGYNVAYWNLDARELTYAADGSLLVNGRPLRFMHFSGYRPETPWILSKYGAANPRVLLSEYPILRAVCDEYGERTRQEGIEQAAHIPYRFNQLRDDVAMTPSMRRLYRDAVIEADQGRGDYPPNAFVDVHNWALLEWFAEPVRDGSRVSRLLYATWDRRWDVRQAYPDPLGTDERALLAWGASSGVAEGELPTGLESVTSELFDDESAPPVVTGETGVNLAGYFQAELGVGQIGRLLVDAVRASGLPYSTWRTQQTLSRQRAAFDDSADPVVYPITIATINADQFPMWSAGAGRPLREGRYTVGVWAWEVEEFPDEFAPSLDLVDEIWAISQFCRDAITAKTDKPVYVIPYQIPDPPAVGELDRSEFGITDDPYFLFAFDYLSVFERKNPLAVVAAFGKAFPPGAGAQLVIKTINGDRMITDRERLRIACAGHPDIVLIEDYVDASTVTSLMADASAYISLHRAEGYGLTLAEALALATPVIATGYSGNLDFMTAADSLLVPFELVAVPPGAGPYPTTARWAQPDVEVAAAHLRWIVEHPDDARALGSRARDRVQAAGTLDRTIDFITARVGEIMAARAIEQRAPTTPVPEVLAHTLRLVHTPPDVDSPSRFPAVSRRLRQGMYRVLAHHDEQVNLRLDAIARAQQTVHDASGTGVQRLQAELAVRETGIAGRLGEIAKRLTQVSAEVQQLGELNRRGTSVTDSIQLRADSIQLRADSIDARVDTLTGRVDHTSADFEAARRQLREAAARLDQYGTALQGADDRIEDLSDRLSAAAHRVAVHDGELSARPFQSDDSVMVVKGPDGSPTLGFDADSALGADYSGFEDVFRGSESFIAERMRPYLDVLRENEPVLDIGCGRGELLGLLRADGIEARGIDLDESMVRRCQAKSLDVQYGDGLEVLRNSPDGAWGAITSIEVIEHLELPQLRELVSQAMRTLRPGGTLLLETVNPHSPPALKTFWLDLTHVRPLYPEALVVLARECGFDSAHVMFLTGSGDLAADLRNCGEYALVAKKS